MTTFFCLLSIFFYGLDAQVFPSLLTRLGSSSLQQGLILGSAFFFFPLSSILAGYWADRVSKRLLLMAAMTLMALPFALLGLIEDVWMRIAAVLLFGLGSGAVESLSCSLLSDRNPGRERSILNISQIFFSLGAAGGPALIAGLLHLLPGMGISGLLFLVALVTAAAPFGFLFDGGEGGSPAGPPAGSWAAVLRDRTLLRLSLSLFLYVAAESGSAAWLAKYGELYLGLSPSLSPICLSLFWAGLGLSRALVGFFTISLSNRRLLSASLLLSTAFQVLSFLMRDRSLALASFFVLGFGMGPVWPTLIALAGSLFRESSGTAVGLLVALGGLGLPAVQLLIGLLSAPHLLGLRACLIALALLSLANLLVVQGCLDKGVCLSQNA